MRLTYALVLLGLAGCGSRHPALGDVYIDQYGRDDDNLTRCIITAANERGVVLECPGTYPTSEPDRRPTSHDYLAARYRLAP